MPPIFKFALQSLVLNARLLHSWFCFLHRCACSATVMGNLCFFSFSCTCIQDPNCNFLEHFETDQRQAFRKMVIDMVSLVSFVLQSCILILYSHDRCTYMLHSSLYLPFNHFFLYHRFWPQTCQGISNISVS